MVNDQESIQVTSGTEGREREMSSLDQPMLRRIGVLVPIYTAGFSATVKSNMELCCFPILPSYCCDIFDGKKIIEISTRLSAKRPCVRCLSTMKKKGRQRCMKAGSMADTYLRKERKEHLLSYLASLVSNITIEVLE